MTPQEKQIEAYVETIAELNREVARLKDQINLEERIKKRNDFLKRMEEQGLAECKCDNRGVGIDGHILTAYNSGIVDGYIFNSPFYKIYTYCNK